MQSLCYILSHPVNKLYYACFVYAMCTLAALYVYIYIVVKMGEISKNKVLNIVEVEHDVTPCFTYAGDDYDLQTGAEDGWVRYF